MKQMPISKQNDSLNGDMTFLRVKCGSPFYPNVVPARDSHPGEIRTALPQCYGTKAPYVQRGSHSHQKKRLAQAEKRLTEIDRLFIRIYEDNVAGRINDEKFSMMSANYENEQKQLKEEIVTLRDEIEIQERQIENLEEFIRRVYKFEDMEDLTPYALRELVKAIYVGAPDKSSGKRKQSIHICYDLIGFIPVEELMAKQETA